jgi:methyl-accepting chemotaxis protein
VTQNTNLHPATRVAIEFLLVLVPFVAMWWLAINAAQGSTHDWIIGSGIVFIVLFCFVVWTAIRRVRVVLSSAIDTARRIGSGDLSAKFDLAKGGQLGELMTAMQEMHEHTLKALADVRGGVATVVSASSQISRDNSSLQSRTDSQASALEQTSTAMEQLTATVEQNADHAIQAGNLVVSATQQAQAGGVAMEQVVHTMGSIKDSSRKIVDIIGLIDAIAFQTNILALNAAVEAARAGEHGRGFAIVASEVRTLAQRSASAAKDIRSLIHQSVETVNSGSTLVDGAGKTMAEIVTSVESLARIVRHISDASSEQRTSLASVNEKIADVGRKSVSTTRLFNEVISASNGLNEQAAALYKSLALFGRGEREYATTQEAATMVERAVAYLNAYGRDALLADVNKLSAGQFVERDLYLMVLNVDDYKFIAHGLNPRVLGVDVRNSKNVEGKYYMREIVDTARQHGHGWVEYKWNHPITNEVKDKATFVQRVGDLVIACGAYKED